uniref:Pentacotripeptide-repeat region of PRORP domain-containing protein n=1 Tax=Arcella intermedia TaxID=1963864 RepID=A0A6B2KZW1_9EUKA
MDACDRKKRYFGRDKEMRDYQSISVAYYKNVPPLYEKISELIEEMEQKGVQSSRLIYTLLLKYFSEKQDKSKIYDILSSMKFNMTALDNIAVNVLLHMYVKDKDVTGMEHLYNQMFGQNLTPHLDTFNTMLSIYVYNQDSHNVDKILDLLEKKKFLWDSYTYHEVITDYIQRGNSYKASNLFSKMLNDNITPLSATWFILLMHFAKTSYFDTFESFFELAKQSKALPRALLASVTIARRLIQSDKNEDLTSLKNVIEEILSGPELAKLDHTPRMIVYRSLLLYICKRGTVEDVENVTKRFRDIGVPLDEIMYCLLLGFYISNGLSITGLVENMFAEGINDHRPYQFALMYFSENDDFSTFSSVYRRLEERNLMSTALYNNLIMVYCEKGLENLVMTVLDQMIERGFHPNIKTYSVILYMYLQRENFTAFEDFVTRVYKDKVRLDTVFWNVMLKFHSTKGDYGSLKSVFSHLENSEEYHPDLSTYNIMISAFGHKGDLSEAESYFDKLLASGIRPTTKTFESMMLFYVKEDQKEKIFNLFPKMKECKVSPNPRFYHFLLNFLLRDSQWDDLKQVMKVMEETGVAIEERLATTVKGKMVEKQRPDVIEVLDRLDKHKVILREIY